MEISVSELRKVSELLFSHLENSGNQNIEIPYDYYWNVPKEIRYDVSKNIDSDQCDLGQLTDDWESLKGICEGEDPPISYALVWLGEIFKAIGDDLVA